MKYENPSISVILLSCRCFVADSPLSSSVTNEELYDNPEILDFD